MFCQPPRDKNQFFEPHPTFDKSDVELEKKRFISHTGKRVMMKKKRRIILVLQCITMSAIFFLEI